MTWASSPGTIKFTFSASAHFPPSYLATRLQRLDLLWAEARAAEESSVESKFALNAMLGVWSMTEHVAYHLSTTSDPDDVIAEKVQVTPAPGSEMRDESYVFRDYVTKTKMLSFASLRPVHQICLSQERLVMAKLNYMLDRLQIPRRLLSFRNDGASIQPGKHLQALRDALKVTYGGLTRLQRHEKLRRCLRAPIEALSSSETPVFRLKEYTLFTSVEGVVTQEPLEPDMPGGELRIREAPPLELPEQPWHLTYEPQEGPDDFYERVVRPQVVEQGLPALITGPAGCGKSHVLLRCEADLKAAGHIVDKISLTHVACRRLEDAKTAHSFIQRHVLHGRFNGWLLIDECSMLPAPVLTLLENLANMGVKFVLFGDWNQLSPPMNRWRATPLRGDLF